MTELTYGEMRSRAERVEDEKIKESVLAGLKVLQDKYGDGWVEKIDCHELDLRDGGACVLGQVCGSYGTGVNELYGESFGSSRDKWAAQHGFNVDEDAFYSEDDDFVTSEERQEAADAMEEAWDALDMAWHAVLCNGTEGPS